MAFIRECLGSAEFQGIGALLTFLGIVFTLIELVIISDKSTRGTKITYSVITITLMLCACSSLSTIACLPDEIVNPQIVETNTSIPQFTLTQITPTPTADITQTMILLNDIQAQTMEASFVDMTVTAFFATQTSTAEEVMISTYAAMTVSAIYAQTGTPSP